MSAETSPQLTLSDLFSKDPRELTREEKLRIVAELRQAREKWGTERQAAKAEGRKTKRSRGISKKSIKGVILDDDFFKDLES